ncbi:MAG: regulatory protein RecX [Ktedonobacterales bacterium]
MRITAIEPQSRRVRVYNLYLDGRLAGQLDGTLVSALGLEVGQDLSAVEYEQLQLRNEEGRLLDRALSFLAPRPRSRAEVRRRLLAPKRRNPSPPPRSEQVERVLDHLESLELLDDRQFADFWVENRERFSPRSARALAHELRQRGVAGETIEEVSKPERDEQHALAAGRQRLRALSTVSYPDFQARLGQFLLRRGFDYEIVRRVTRQLWEESGDSTSGDAGAPDGASSETRHG